MHFTTRSWIKQSKWFSRECRDSPRLIWKKVVGVMLLLIVIWVALMPFNPLAVDAYHGPKKQPVQTISICSNMFFSHDGNPFALCPGPFPRGGNCVWWAWEQWHLRGYNLPTNWGNPASWVADAMHAGLQVGTTPRVNAIAVFPRGDGVWAFGPEGHVAFVTAVTNGGTTFNVTYQDYGSVVPMYTGIGYNVSVINQPRYQNGMLRFIYFPHTIKVQHISHHHGRGKK
jgi:hypothetical protein